MISKDCTIFLINFTIENIIKLINTVLVNSFHILAISIELLRRGLMIISRVQTL